ncbi:hypothetical protein EZV73_13715 [Acidaminobacter sp. JC074]|uniref:EFR1 family ferrodoxin n=1 Tax=Acidaminobacter sp. JC074 TaxID=2530199 RepID=UPI001F0E904B|nr:EFR1 family ferrodoxin [Acidaminobacter sp. JC074]MCH4888645.1 hypothetical protein [Acidaminobacter sp. JC074]
MNYSIFYFSGTGNTWYAAQKLKLALGKNHVSCYSIENDYLKDNLESIIEASDQIIIGYPIYGSEAPRIMQTFINDLPTMKVTKPLAVFCTQAFMSGDGANYLSDVFLKKGYHLMQTLELKMSNNFYVPVFVRAFKVGNREKINRRNEKAHEKIIEFAGQIRQGEAAVKSVNDIQNWLGDTQRKHMDTYIEKVNESIYADNTCTKCGMCVKLCPVENIKLTDKITFSNHCIACMRCYQSCPKASIQITDASKDLDKYPRFKGPIDKFDFNVLKV